MFRIAQISLIVLLATIAAVGPAGPTVHKMACFDSGQVSYSMDLDLCCLGDANAEVGHSVLAVCCNFDQLSLSVSDFDFQRIDFPVFAIFPAPPSVFNFRLVDAEFISPMAQLRAPPLPTIQRLALLAVFNI